MTITTEEAERLARGCDIDGFTERAAALRSLAAERDALLKEREYEREAYDHNLDLRDKVIEARVSQLEKAEAERDALKAENEKLRAALSRAKELFLQDEPHPKVSQAAADLVAKARRDALEEAARRLEELHRQHKYNPKTGEGSEHDVGYYRALSEGAGWIRALDPLVSKGAADLVAQARREALEEAARRILIYFNNNHIAQNAAAAIRALKGEGDD